MFCRPIRSTWAWIALVVLLLQLLILLVLHLFDYSIVISTRQNSEHIQMKEEGEKTIETLNGEEEEGEGSRNEEHFSNNMANVHLDKSKEHTESDQAPDTKKEDPKIDIKLPQKQTTNNLPLRYREKQIQPLSDKITFSDDLNANVYSIDYGLSHPMDNACRFPILIKDEPDLLHTVEHYVEYECPIPENETHVLVEQLHTGELLVGRRFMSNGTKDFKCFAQELTGTLRPKNVQLQFVGDFVELPVNKRFFFEKDQFHVQCENTTTGEIVFTDAFTHIPSKERLKPPRLDDTLNFSVSILILDSNGRNQFYRHAPQTLRFMKEEGFEILHGYNKVADNSAVNLLPLLAGLEFEPKKHGAEHLVRENMSLTGEMAEDDVLLYVEMLIKLMKERGCATLWNDDIMVPHLGFLNYDAFKGFFKPIADYYFRPYYEYLYQKQDARKACVNGHLITRRMVEIWERFATKYARECHFGFTFLTALTHDNANSVELLDQKIYNGLLRMKYGGVLDNTVMIIMGDHGQRMSSVQHTYSGRIEERMPMFGIYFPEKFRQAYPDKLRNFKINKNRLVSNYDLHETLRELLDFNDVGRKPVGLSLFNEVPKNRTCTDARIPSNHCMCQEKLDPSVVPREIRDKMFAELRKYVKRKTDKLNCINKVKLKTPVNFTPYTISAQARLGVRYPSMWNDVIFNKIRYDSSMNEILDVEFDTEVQVGTGFQLQPALISQFQSPANNHNQAILNISNNQNVQREQQKLFKLRSRMIYHKETDYVRLIAKPLIIDAKQKCNQTFIIEKLCSCFEGF